MGAISPGQEHGTDRHMHMHLKVCLCLCGELFKQNIAIDSPLSNSTTEAATGSPTAQLSSSYIFGGKTSVIYVHTHAQTSGRLLDHFISNPLAANLSIQLTPNINQCTAQYNHSLFLGLVNTKSKGLSSSEKENYNRGSENVKCYERCEGRDGEQRNSWMPQNRILCCYTQDAHFVPLIHNGTTWRCSENLASNVSPKSVAKNVLKPPRTLENEVLSGRPSDTFGSCRICFVEPHDTHSLGMESKLKCLQSKKAPEEIGIGMAR